MSKTVEELIAAYNAAYHSSHDDQHRAGIAAVIRAVRDDIAPLELVTTAAEYECGEIREMFNEILGSDAGEKVMDYVCNDVRVIITQDTAYCAPPTDPAPDVCEWTVKGRSYTYTDIRTQCGDDVVLSLFATAGRIGTCGKCHRPIKFTEAKT